MDGQGPREEGKSVRRPRKGTLRRLARTAAVLAFVVVAFLGLLAGATQTQLFRDRLRAVVLTQLDSLLDARVELGELRGNLITGFSIDSISVRVADAELVAADRVLLRYDLLRLPGKKISVDEIIVVRPRVQLRRGRDGVWNFVRMIRPASPDTSVRGPFDWDVALESLRVEDGSVALVDSAALADGDHGPVDMRFFEYHSLALQDLDLDLALRFRRDRKELKIRALSLRSEAPRFLIRQLTADLRVTPSEVRVQDLHIVTDGSRIDLRAGLSKVDLLGGIDLAALRRCPVQLSLQAEPFDFEEFKLFLPQVSFLHGPVWVSLEAGGEFGRISISSLDLRMVRSELRAYGTVANLDDPANLFLDVTIPEGTIHPADPLALLPEFNLPDMTETGVAGVRFSYVGTPLDFSARASVSTQAGAVECSTLTLKIGGPEVLKYSARVGFRQVDMALLLKDPGLRSSLSGSATFEGEGIRLPMLSGQLGVELDSSTFRGLPAGGTQLGVTASNGRVAGDARLLLGATTSRVSAEMRRRVSEAPAFTFAADVRKLNLADITDNPALQSDIAFRAEGEGSGEGWGDLHLDGMLRLSPSIVRGNALDSTTVEVHLDQRRPAARSLTVASDVADVELEGTFDIASLIDLVRFHVEGVRQDLGEQFAWLDSSLARVAAPVAVPSGPAGRTLPVDAWYSVNVKDLQTLAGILGGRSFDGVGAVTGSIRGDDRSLSVDGVLSSVDFFYGSADSGLLIQGGRGTFEVRALGAGNVLRDGGIDLEFSAADIHLNQTALDTVRVSVGLNGGTAGFQASGNIDGGHHLAFEGSASLTTDSIVASFRRVAWAYRDFRWEADPGARLSASAGMVRLEDLLLRRGEETIAAGAMLAGGGRVFGKLEANGLDLADIGVIVPAGGAEAIGSLRGRIRLQGQLRGTIAEPEFSLSLNTGPLGYQNVSLGGMEGYFFYKDQQLDVSLYLREVAGADGQAPELSIAGRVPLDLRIPAQGSIITDRPVDLAITSNGIDIGVVDPLLPTFDQLRGQLICDLRVGGTLRHPEYSGGVRLQECLFLFVPNNIAYTFSGNLQAAGEQIRVVDAVLGNVPGDLRGTQQGTVRITGSFNFRDLKPGDFNLAGVGSLLVVKETTRKSSLSVYGNLFAEIGPGGLTFTGSLEESLLRGELLIRNSNLVFPPTQGEIRGRESFSVPVVVLVDTGTRRDQQLSAWAERYFGSAGAGPVARGEISQVGLLGGRSFMDGLRYDLRIETGGSNTEIRMLFNPLSGEELVASLNGKFTITGDGKQWFGDLLIDRGYYNFLKRFDASGTIRFRGDLMDPELNITARYSGTRALRDTVGTEKLEKVQVSFHVSGTRYRPKSDFSMTIDDVDYLSYNGPKSNDVQSDAIQFIVYGSFPLTAAQRGQVPTDVQRTVSGSLLSGAGSLLTGALSEFLRSQTGFINSVEFRYQSQGSVTESADIRLSGMLWNGYWRYGGQILDDPLNNANVSLLYSFDAIFNKPSLRNLMFELERRVERLPLGGVTDFKRVNSARLFYRFSF